MNLHVPGFLRHDALRKIVALFFATLIWLAVDSELHETLVLRNVPVSVKYDPAIVVLQDAPPTVDIVLRGSRKRLDDVTHSDIEVVVPVPSDINEGVNFYGIGLSPKNNIKRTPPGIRVTSINPNRLDLRIDRIVTKADVPVRVQFEGQLKEGYRMVRTQTAPATVTISGPHRKLLEITEVLTEPVLLDDTVVQDFSVTVQLVPVSGVKMTDEVRADVTISRHSTPKALHGLPVALLQKPGYNLQLGAPLPEVTVTVRGAKDALEQLTELSVVPFIDLNTITSPGRYRRQVRVWLDAPEGVVADAPNPGWVEVTLKASTSVPTVPNAPQPPPGMMPQ